MVNHSKERIGRSAVGVGEGADGGGAFHEDGCHGGIPGKEGPRGSASKVGVPNTRQSKFRQPFVTPTSDSLLAFYDRRVLTAVATKIKKKKSSFTFKT